MAEGVISHFGFGYHSSFLGTPINLVATPSCSALGNESRVVALKGMPLGVFLFVGIGYKFGSKEEFNVAGETVSGAAISLDPAESLHLFLQGRAFGRYIPHKDFSVAGFIGVKGSLMLPEEDFPSGAYPVFGVRVEPLFLYVEYAAVLEKNFSKVFSHDVSVGFNFFKS